MADRVPSVPLPTDGVDPRVSLATAIHAGRGVYAVLAGSGLSTSAGVKTGWQVVQDLIRRVAAADAVDTEELGDEPDKWWTRNGRPEPRYDTLLEALAPTDAARQLLLRQYFDPLPGAGGPIGPTDAHLELGRLCAKGYIRVILTTNFDRLIERGLDQAGISPQVIASPAAVSGMTPLVHAPATVIKLHGDYTMLGLRNTPGELQSYPTKWATLLARVLDEYGLLIVGWSADWDVALVECLEHVRSRRYPLFWGAHHGQLGEAARRLVAQHHATVINHAGADELFQDLVQRIDRLERIAGRARRPRRRAITYNSPEGATTQMGWTSIPLLQLRAAAVVSDAPADDCEPIRPSQRQAILRMLGRAALSRRIIALSERRSALATGGPVESSSLASAVYTGFMRDWALTPDGFQNLASASYRLGTDGAHGVSCLVEVRFPDSGAFSGSTNVKCIVDVGLSILDMVTLEELAEILRDSLILATSLPAALEDAMPPSAALATAEVHLRAATIDGHNQNRSNHLGMRIDLSSLGPETGTVSTSYGHGVEIADTFAERDAAQLVVDAMERFALNNGHLEPDEGLDKLKRFLGLSA